MRRNYIIYFYTVIQLFILPPVYGQDLLPKEQEREIKLSGKYFFSECSSFDETEAKECAIRDLTQIVLIEMIKDAIKSDETAIKKTMEMGVQTARLNLTGRIRILAWIEKNNVKKGPTPTPETLSSSTQTATPTTSSETDSPIQTGISEITNPIIRDLVKCETFDQFRRTADGFRRRGKVVYGTNKASFVHPENCLVAVFNSGQKLIAFLDAGQDSRIDFLTGKTVQNIEQQFAGSILYWIILPDTN